MKLLRSLRSVCAAAVAAAVLAACNGGSGSINGVVPPPKPVPITPVAGNYIKHVVIIMQENRSFDTMFAGFPGANAPTTCNMSTGQTIPMPVSHLEDGIDIAHFNSTWKTGYNGGKMNGFDLVHEGTFGTGPPAGAYACAHVARNETAPYWSMAKQYTLDDMMFETEASGSYTSHQDIIAGYPYITPNEVLMDYPDGLPWGCDAAETVTTSYMTMDDGAVHSGGPFPCFTQYRTMADTLDRANVSWKYYAPTISDPNEIGGKIWTGFDSIRNVRYGKDWSKIISPETTVLTDITSGKLAQVSWVIPDLANSDHPTSFSNTGPSWVSSIVNEIGQSKYWNDTAIIVLWDDWGGWYDNVPPPQLDQAGLGGRVASIVISPYARHGYVDHTQYEFTSILQTINQIFNVPPLANHSVRRASPMFNSFDFTQAPSVFKPISAPMSARAIMARPHSYLPPDRT